VGIVRYNLTLASARHEPLDSLEAAQGEMVATTAGWCQEWVRARGLRVATDERVPSGADTTGRLAGLTIHLSCKGLQE
jgi:hypothetical protein